VDVERIEAWIRLRDAARFKRDAAESAAAVRGIGTAAQSATTKLGSALQRVGAVGKRVSSVGRDLRHHVTLPIVAVGAASVYAAAHFNNAMEMIHTQSGASQREVHNLYNRVLNLAEIRPQGPQDLAEALYRLEGAGLRGAKAMKALKAASDLATVGNSDVESTAKTLAQTWFVGIKGAGSLHNTVAELNATVGQGDLRMQQLVDALGTGVLPAAKEAGLSLQDVTGALAVFGDETNNTSGFMAQFATALHFLYNPTEKSNKQLKKLGLSGRKLAEDMRKPRGMLTALSDLRDHLDKLPGGHKGIAAEQALGNILPGGRGRVMLVLLNQLDRYEKKMNAIRDTHKNFRDSVRKQMQQPLQRLRSAWSSVQVAAIKFGNALLPAVVPVAEKLANVISHVVKWFSKLSPQQRRIVLGLTALAAAAGPVLVVIGLMAQGLGALGSVLVFLAANPIVLIIGALVAAGVALVVLYKKSESFRNTVNGVFNAVKSVVVDAIHAVVAILKWWWRTTKNVAHWIAGAVHYVVSVLLGLPVVGASIRKVTGFFKGMWIVFRNVVGWIGDKVGKLIGFFAKLPGVISGAAKNLWEPLKSGLVSVVNWIIGVINTIIRGINNTVGRLPGVGDIKEIGTLRQDAAARLRANNQAYKGYQGIPTGPNPRAGKGGSGPYGRHHKAMGGTFADWSVVGEQGPELAFHTPSYTKIEPINRGARGAAGLGEMTFHFEIPVIMGGKQVTKVVASQKAEWDARKGKVRANG
jgi:TP901 family phage tail tape measure protein